MRALTSRLVLLSLLVISPYATDAEAGRRFRAAKLLERTEIAENILHDVYSLRLGSGDFDRIRVHRVVRIDDDDDGDDRRPEIEDTEHAVFLIHGAGGTFASAFLAGTLPSAETEDQSLIEIVDLVPGNRLLDYGHIDIGTASNAPFLAWDAIADWIRDRDADACDDDDDDDDESSDDDSSDGDA